MARPPKTGHVMLTAAERALKALELRKAGATFRRIGQELGCSEQRAHQIVTRELTRLNKDRAEEASQARRLELERLDALSTPLYAKAIRGGEERAVEAYLKLMERRSRLLGLDAPVKREVAGAGGAPLVPQVTVDLSGLSTEDVEQLERLLEKAGDAGPRGD